MSNQETLHGQTAAFGAMMLNALPRDITREQMQDWMDSPNELKEYLVGLCIRANTATVNMSHGPIESLYDPRDGRIQSYLYPNLAQNHPEQFDLFDLFLWRPEGLAAKKDAPWVSGEEIHEFFRESGMIEKSANLQVGYKITQQVSVRQFHHFSDNMDIFLFASIAKGASGDIYVPGIRIYRESGKSRIDLFASKLSDGFSVHNSAFLMYRWPGSILN